MTRTLVGLAALAAVLGVVPAHAAPPGVPQSPVKLIAEPGSCPSGYYELGYIGPEGARWKICQRHPIIDPIEP